MRRGVGAELELWHPCVTICFPPEEEAFIDQIKKQNNERSRRILQVREANVSAWRILYGFGEGPWTVSRKASPTDLAIQSRWVQLNWPIHRRHGAFCPKNWVCSMCVDRTPSLRNESGSTIDELIGNDEGVCRLPQIEPGESRHFYTGDKVRILGLVSKLGRRLNQRDGEVATYIQSSGRYGVVIVGFGTKYIRPANLTFLDANVDCTSPCLRGDCACDIHSLINVASVLGYDVLGVPASELDRLQLDKYLFLGDHGTIAERQWEKYISWKAPLSDTSTCWFITNAHVQCDVQPKFLESSLVMLKCDLNSCGIVELK